jgi:hypothetical protein
MKSGGNNYSMKRLICLLLAICATAVLPLNISAFGISEETYEYQGYTPSLAGELPSEQSMAEIQQMSAVNQVYERELRSQPGGGPGLGEQSIPLDSEIANILALAFMGAVFVILKQQRRSR